MTRQFTSQSNIEDLIYWTGQESRIFDDLDGEADFEESPSISATNLHGNTTENDGDSMYVTLFERESRNFFAAE